MAEPANLVPGLLLIQEQIDRHPHLRQGSSQLDTKKSASNDGDAAPTRRLKAAFMRGLIHGLVQTVHIFQRTEIMNIGQPRPRDIQPERLSRRSPEAGDRKEISCPLSSVTDIRAVSRRDARHAVRSLT